MCYRDGMPRAISYRRVSSGPQESRDGLDRQSAAAAKWIADHPEHNLVLDDALTDAARSAWKGEHVGEDGELGRFLTAVTDRHVPAGTWLIVEALDRLSRQNPWKASHQLSGLVVAGLTIVTTIDSKVYNLASGIGDMILSIVAMAEANKSSEDKSVRVRSGKAAAIDNARNTKAAVYQNCPAWLAVDDAASSTNRGTRTYRKLEGPIRTIQTIYPLALDHGAGYITTWLATHDVPAFGKSGKWNTRYVRDLLTTKAVLGHLETKHGLLENQLPKIIDEDLWLRVQAAQDARSKSSGGGMRNGSFVNLFAGLGECHDCGGMMRTNTHPTKPYRYLECLNRVRKYRPCGNRSRYRVDVLDKAVLDNLGLLTLSNDRNTPLPEDVVALEARLVTLREQEKRLAGRIARSADDELADLLMSELRTLRSEVTETATRIAVAQKEVAVAAAPVKLSDLDDRVQIHAALKRHGIRVVFGEAGEVMVIARGLVLMVIARQGAEPPWLMIGNGDDRVATIQRGKVRIADAPEGFPKLDPRLGQDVLKHMRRFSIH